MSEVIDVAAHRIRLVEPSEAGKYDPPMHEWLALPVGAGDNHAVCPACGSKHFGTANPCGYFRVRVCHDEHRIGCRARYRNVVTPDLIHEVVGALCGEKQRRWTA